jgi:hypothetical protein
MKGTDFITYILLAYSISANTSITLSEQINFTSNNNTLTHSYMFIYVMLCLYTSSYYFLVWCPQQIKRIAPLSFLYGCRKRRLKD